MAFYLIKNGGTATSDDGRYLTLPGGSFANIEPGGYYNSASTAALATTSPGDGDVMVYSNLHTFGKSLSQWYSVATGASILHISVDDTDMTRYLRGATEIALTGDVRFGNGFVTVRGLNLISDDDLIMSANTTATLIDCVVTLAAGGQVQQLYDNTTLTVIDTEIIFGSSTSHILLQSGAKFSMVGGRISGTGINNLMFNGFINGGAVAEFTGVDLQDVTGNLLGNVGGLGYDLIDVAVTECKLDPTVTRNDVPLQGRNHRLSMVGNFDVGSGERSIVDTQYKGIAFDDTTIYRDESTAYFGGDKISVRVDTNATCSRAATYDLDFMATFANLATVGEKTVRIHFASTDVLTDNDVWVDVTYSNQTAGSVNQFMSTMGLATDTGTEHADDSGNSTWIGPGGTDLVGYNEYYIDVDTSSAPGANCIPNVFIRVAKPGVSIHFSPLG